MKILVAIDDSKYSNATVRSLPNFFTPQNTEVRILHVVVPLLPTTASVGLLEMSAGYAPELQGLVKEGQAIVAKYAQQLRSDGFHADSFVETGDVRDSILKCAADWHADLILLGGRGRNSLERLLLGSVAYSVVRDAHCSVLVVRPPAEK